LSEHCHFGTCNANSYPKSTCPKHTTRIKEDLSLLFSLMAELEDFIPYESYYGPSFGSQKHSGYSQGPRMEYLSFEANAQEKFRSWRHYTLIRTTEMRMSDTPANIGEHRKIQEMKSWAHENFHEITRSYGVRNFTWDIQALISDADALLGPKSSPKFAGICECGDPCYTSQSSGTARCESCDTVFPVEQKHHMLLSEMRNSPLTIHESSLALHSQGMRVTPRQIIWWSRSGRIPTHSLTPTGRHRHLFGQLYDLAVSAKKIRSPIHLEEPEEKEYSMEEFMECDEIRKFAHDVVSKLSKFKRADLRCFEDTREPERKRAVFKIETPDKEVFTPTIVKTGIKFQVTKISRKSPRSKN
jgi:hypothetical protein